jgi:hypothetical protein
MEWFNTLDTMLKIYWIIALAATLVFIIQTIIALLGGDFSGDVDSSGDAGDTTPFFSVRNLINFLLGAGWGGVCFYNTVESKGLLMLIAVFTGLFFFLLFFGLVKLLLKLSQDNSFNIEETLNQTAEVYLAIPESKTGKGKIQISVKGSIHEIDAITAGEKLSTGNLVKVIRIIDNQTIEVEKI